VGRHTRNNMVGDEMSQELQFPVSKTVSVEFRSDGEYVKRGAIWVVGLVGGETYLGCSLIAANCETFYVACEDVFGDLPAYVVPMERDE